MITKIIKKMSTPTKLNLGSIMAFSFLVLILSNCRFSVTNNSKTKSPSIGKFKLITTDTFHFNNFVDCNMAEAWIGDTLRIFPGKYGEDPVWGYAKDLKFASGSNADEVFSTPAEKYVMPVLPLNAPIGKPGLHGAIWFETVYQSKNDPTGKTLFAIYHNENYPETLPYNPSTKEGKIKTSAARKILIRVISSAIKPNQLMPYSLP